MPKYLKICQNIKKIYFKLLFFKINKIYKEKSSKEMEKSI